MDRKPRGMASTAKDPITRQKKETGSDNIKMFNFRIDADLLKQVKLHCVKQDRSMAAFATDAIIEKLKAEGVRVK